MIIFRLLFFVALLALMGVPPSIILSLLFVAGGVIILIDKI